MNDWRLLPLLLLLATGCAHQGEKAAFRPTGDPVLDSRQISLLPEKDRVLWQYRIALTAMRAGQFAVAKELLDEALLNLGGMTGKDSSARKSRRFFSPESRKKFYGEPYERVMAYYYRGILYWMEGEPDNARACFRSAQFHDSDTEEKTYSNDYLLLEYLEGLATAKLGGDGSDAFARAQKVSRQGEPQPYHPNANVLVFLDFGHGPQKYATGEYQEQLRFRPGRTVTRSALIRTAGLTVPVGPSDDLYFQATTRGGRVMDHVLANKAVFKSTTGVVGDVGIISGAVLATRKETQGAALVVGGVGLINKALSEITNPQADTRSWDNLPQYLGFVALALPPGEHQISCEFVDAQQRPLVHLTKKIDVKVEANGRDQVIYISEHSKTPLTL